MDDERKGMEPDEGFKYGRAADEPGPDEPGSDDTQAHGSEGIRPDEMVRGKRLHEPGPDEPGSDQEPRPDGGFKR